MIVKAHQGSNGVNLKFASTEMMALKIRSRRAQAASENPPEPGAGPMMPPGSCIHPQVLAFRAIQWFALLAVRGSPDDANKATQHLERAADDTRNPGDDRSCGSPVR